MRLHPKKWKDMSNYLVHFTKDKEGVDPYLSMLGICSRQVLSPKSEFGIGKGKAPANTQQKSVCFSEVPPGQWSRLVDRRATKFGIGFTKEFVLSKGGGPIWYAWKDTPHYYALQDMMHQAKGDAEAPIWSLTPLIDAPGKYGANDYLFDWEREWRHVGDMGFRTEDVEFLLLDEENHQVARKFFEDAEYENMGPAYHCPYIDPSWSMERILEALSNFG